MGPVLFQVLVGAVVPFEWMVGWMAWRAYQCDSHAISERPDDIPSSKVSASKSLGAPVVAVLVMALLLAIMAFVALVAYQEHLRRSW